MSLTKLMRHRCDITRSGAKVADGIGGVTGSYSTVFHNVRCRSQPLTGDEAVHYMKETGRVAYRIYLLQLGILVDDRIEMTHPATASDNAYDIVLVRDIDELNRLITVDALEVIP